MGGGLLNKIASGELNIMLNGNPKKTFFKTTYSKHTNFELQRFQIESSFENSLSLFTDSLFKFSISNIGDLLIDTFFSFSLPDIYSPIYTIPVAYDMSSNGQYAPSPDISGLIYCQPYEFRWIENIGVQFIKKVTYLIDGRPIQEYSGHYLYCKSKRDLTSTKLELFNTMIGNTKEFNEPESFNNNNGNYPSVSWGGLNESNYPNGLEPSIRGKRIFVPLYLWETFSSYQSFPLLLLQYSKLEIHIECRPLCELFKVRDLNYFESWVKNMCPRTQLPKVIRDTFKYYDPPFIRPDLSDERFNILFFLKPPPANTFCLGDISYNTITNLTPAENIQKVFKDISIKHYSKVPNFGFENISLYSTIVFLSEDERIYISEQTQQYLVKKVFERTIYNVQGVRKEDTHSYGMTAAWMWFFQRTDVVLRNEWSNYSNWLYNNKMPYPCILSLDLYNSLSNVNIPYISPQHKKYALNNLNPCVQYISGPTHPGNEKNIMVNWGLYCNELVREEIMPYGINNYIENYLKVEGDPEDGIYCYNFNIEKNSSLNPSGAMNMMKFNNITFEFTTIDPYRERYNEIDLTSINKIFNENSNETNNQTKYCVAASHFQELDYNYNLHIMEERYNILQFSNGIVDYLFPN
jgi:hypothetical protein